MNAHLAVDDRKFADTLARWGWPTTIRFFFLGNLVVLRFGDIFLLIARKLFPSWVEFDINSFFAVDVSSSRDVNAKFMMIKRMPRATGSYDSSPIRLDYF